MTFVKLFRSFGTIKSRRGYQTERCRKYSFNRLFALVENRHNYSPIRVESDANSPATLKKDKKLNKKMFEHIIYFCKFEKIHHNFEIIVLANNPTLFDD